MSENIDDEREFKSLQGFQEVVFPNSFKQKKEEKELKNFEEYGKIIACRFIENLKKKI